MTDGGVRCKAMHSGRVEQIAPGRWWAPVLPSNPGRPLGSMGATVLSRGQAHLGAGNRMAQALCYTP